MGGGIRNFIPETVKDVYDTPGSRKDGKDLLQEWVNSKKSKTDKVRLIFEEEDLKSLNPNEIDYLMGKILITLNSSLFVNETYICVTTLNN